MTEKRFTIQGIGISDHQRKRLYDLQTVDGFISVRDLLNELSEENEQLKKRIDRIDIILDDLNGAVYISRDDAIKALNKIDKVIIKR